MTLSLFRGYCPSWRKCPSRANLCGKSSKLLSYLVLSHSLKYLYLSKDCCDTWSPMYSYTATEDLQPSNFLPSFWHPLSRRISIGSVTSHFPFWMWIISKSRFSLWNGNTFGWPYNLLLGLHAEPEGAAAAKRVDRCTFDHWAQWFETIAGQQHPDPFNGIAFKKSIRTGGECVEADIITPATLAALLSYSCDGQSMAHVEYHKSRVLKGKPLILMFGTTIYVGCAADERTLGLFISTL